MRCGRKELIRSTETRESLFATLHELAKVGVGTVEYIGAAGGDLAIDSGDFSVDVVVPHECLVEPNSGRSRIRLPCTGIKQRE